MTTLFEKIIAREVPSDVLYEDDAIIAIRDIAPQAPIHLLIIPKEPIAKVQDVKELDLIGKMVRVAQNLAKELHIESGYRLVINNGAEAGQTVFHLHMHLLGGAPLGDRMTEC